MGSLGNYKVNLIAEYMRQIKISKPNSDEDINKFLKSKEGFFGKVLEEEVDYDFNNDDTIIIDKNEYIGFIFELDGEKAVAYKVKDNISKVEKQEDWDYTYPIVSMSVDELRYLDLNILKEFDYYGEDLSYNIKKTIGKIYGYVYYGDCDENEAYGSVELSDEVLKDLLDKKCTLYLDGNSSGY